MKRLFAYTALSTALFVSGCTSSPTETAAVDTRPTHTTALDDSSFGPAINSNSVVLVDFWASWCGPCLTQGPTIEAVSEEYEGRALVAKLNVDEAKQTTAAFGIEAVPTLIFFKDGQEVERLKGVSSKREIVAVLDSLLP